MSARADLRWVDGRVETVSTSIVMGALVEAPGRVLLEGVTLQEACDHFESTPIRCAISR